MRRKEFLVSLVPALAILGSIWVEAYIPGPRNPPVVASRTIEAYVPVPSEVETILARSCKDCHSFETRWPWYSRLPGVSIILHHDVERARAHMNLSDWEAKVNLGQDEERGVLNGICEELQSDDMPLHSYLLLHPASRLSQADTDIVCSWVGRTVSQPLHPSHPSQRQ